jgi:hypothetical protein
LEGIVSREATFEWEDGIAIEARCFGDARRDYAPTISFEIEIDGVTATVLHAYPNSVLGLAKMELDWNAMITNRRLPEGVAEALAGGLERAVAEEEANGQ